jgi:signal transduction histidine kinase
MDLLRFKADAKMIKFLQDLTAINETQEIRIDANRVKQIVINLVSNAIKYTQEGFVKVAAVVRGD